MKIKEYISQNKEKFLNELFELLKIESVSADPNTEILLILFQMVEALNLIIPQLQLLSLQSKP